MVPLDYQSAVSITKIRDQQNCKLARIGTFWHTDPLSPYLPDTRRTAVSFSSGSKDRGTLVIREDGEIVQKMLIDANIDPSAVFLNDDVDGYINSALANGTLTSTQINEGEVVYGDFGTIFHRAPYQDEIQCDEVRVFISVYHHAQPYEWLGLFHGILSALMPWNFISGSSKFF